MANQTVRFSDLSDDEKLAYNEHMTVLRRSYDGYLVYPAVLPTKVVSVYRELTKSGGANKVVKAVVINFFKSHKVTSR